MNPKTTRIVLAASAFLLGLVLFFVTAMLMGGRSATPVAAIGGPFTLTNQNGATVTDADFKGKPHLVFFGFTHCPDVCPTTLFEISELMRALGKDADGVNALFVTVDRQMGPPQWADLGMFLENVMLLAVEAGLATCPQECWAMYPETVTRFLETPAERMLFCGVAIGFEDTDDPANRLRSDRAPADEWLTVRG